MQEHAKQISRECLRLLLELRIKKGLSHEKLARETGLSRSYIGYLEKGERRPTVEVAVKLSLALGVKFSTIIKKVERSAFGARGERHGIGLSRPVTASGEWRVRLKRGWRAFQTPSGHPSD
jgi:transcriptional regulator with XRE-family HTH domain